MFQQLFNDIKKIQSNEFGSLQSLFEDSEVDRDFNSQSESSFGNVRVHFLTLSYTLGSMRCDPQASLLAYTFASLGLDCEPKAKVATSIMGLPCFGSIHDWGTQKKNNQLKDFFLGLFFTNNISMKQT
jgi:hypothetical protein